jgi:hypothetical protein
MVTVTLGACGGARSRGDVVDFKCRERSASYIAIKHLAGEEIGVQMDCEEAGPRVRRWRTPKDGQRIEDVHAVSPEDFERAWKEIDGTGWAFLKDCTNGSLGKRDPVYVFDVKDDQQKASFQCQTVEVPYPYNDIQDPLDVLAQHGQKQLGDDEPAELKALDHKDMQQ